MKEGLRHGDMLLVKIDSLPEGLKEAKTKVLMTGSGGNDHTFTGGKFYPIRNGLKVGFFVAEKAATLLHYEHGNICSVCGYNKLYKVVVCPQCKTDFVKEKKFRLAKVDTGVYEIQKQIEDTHEGMRQVED